MKKIVITEFMDEAAVASLSAAFDVLYDPSRVDDPARLLAAVPHAGAVIVRNTTPMRGAWLAGCAKATVTGRLGVGLDNVDASRGGIADKAAVAAGSAWEGCPNAILTPQVAGVNAESNVRGSPMIAAAVAHALDA